jgi:hypothetical protein
VSDEESKALLPIDEQEVMFYEDILTAVLIRPGEGEQPQVYVPVKPLADALGLSWPGQYERLQRDAVLSQETRSIRVTRMQDQPRAMVCLPLDYVNGWLFGINAGRVKEEVRERLVRYQRECYRVLATAFVRESRPTGSETTLMHIKEMGLAIAQMAEQQMEMERQLSARLDKAAVMVGGHERRISVLEQRLAPGRLISEEQAAEIGLQVKSLAALLGEQDNSKNHYQGVFTELYRRFGVSSYKMIAQSRYGAVLAFLEDWRKSLLR